MKVVAQLLAGNSDLIPRPSLNRIHHAKAMRCGVPMSDIIDDGATTTKGEGRRMARELLPNRHDAGPSRFYRPCITRMNLGLFVLKSL